MIQDIQPHRIDMTFLQKPPQAGDRIICLKDGQALLAPDADGMFLPRHEELRPYLPDPDAAAFVYLFSLDGAAIHYLAEPVDAPAEWTYRNLQDFRALEPKWMSFAVVTAGHLAAWYGKNRFCGQCGRPMRLKNDDRAMVCDACNNFVYPAISPAIIVGVADGDRLLVTRYANRGHKKWALVAGFMEVGETLEDTVRREVMEEVGVKIRNIRYYKSQPWAFSHSLLVGFFADLDGPPDITLDRVELEEAQWLPRRDIPKDDISISLTSEMIEAFRLGVFPR